MKRYYVQTVGCVRDDQYRLVRLTNTFYGWRVNEYFSIHYCYVKDDTNHFGRYVVTHIPTGNAVCKAKTLRNAAYAALEFTQHIDRFSSITQSDLGFTFFGCTADREFLKELYMNMRDRGITCV